MRNFESPTRSTTVSTQAMAATSHPTATLIATQILNAGGNAIDAAIAACAVQCVVEPCSTGIGGDCFALLSLKGSDNILAYNGSGKTPAGLDFKAFQQGPDDKVERQSHWAITIPGAIDAWTQLHKDHGKLPFEDLLAPAIQLAENGYAIAPRVHNDWALEESLLSKNDTAKRIFLPKGRAPKIGEIHKQPELGATLRQIAKQGREGFYKGPVAEDMVEYLQSIGGSHTLEDFANARGEYVTPIKTRFLDHDVFECPPNGQGIIALMILNILARFKDTEDALSANRLHREIEATRLAYAARDALLADPNVAKVPTDYLLSDELADELAAKIDLEHAIQDLPEFASPVHRDTVYISIVDKDRNCVSFINSVFDSFGTGFVAPKSGVLFHNRGESFSVDPTHPNCLAPNKRPLHTIIPGMLVKDGKAVMPFGVMGGYYQAMGHAHLLAKILDCKMDIQEAINLPRVMPVSGSTNVEAEHTLPADIVQELERRGFHIVPAETPIGGAQAIFIDWEKGTLLGGSEPRKDGCALGL
ncbi:gamma-glutamyltransferase [Marinomonas sp. CT5]|uniref:gamma-glutamyltransferase n=1 Tax=Marinomonas sp. CT5 TaxID=2066133 RepID=UPI001BAF15F1|nr:gamma-glutamyltransferase [Marinomonas sp. CT5]QUX97992.1 gamma-glutamyltransferase [Marinomonas sp. CT5]